MVNHLKVLGKSNQIASHKTIYSLPMADIEFEGQSVGISETKKFVKNTYNIELDEIIFCSNFRVSMKNNAERHRGKSDIFLDIYKLGDKHIAVVTSVSFHEET
jgi:hypothetical protein